MVETPTTDDLHRTAKAFLDAGVADLNDAYRRLASFRMVVYVGRHAATSRAGQAAVLTAVNAGVRCLLGGIYVTGDVDAPLTIPIPGAATLGEAAAVLGARLVKHPPDGTPVFIVGEAAEPVREARVTLHASAIGWNGGVLPSPAYVDENATPLAGVIAGAIGVSEMFQHLSGHSSVAGYRPAGLALWTPGAPWQTAESGPALDLLPSQLWLIGLGHLGQAYLWTLGLLPYADPRAVQVVLQDVDQATRANQSTSPLTFPQDVGLRKTRLTARWADYIGFTSHIVERRFSDRFRRQSGEPGLALFGVDNPLARAQCEGAGFERVIDAGLGSKASDFLAFQLNGFPGPDAARKIWNTVSVPELPDETELAPAYLALLDGERQRGETACGVVRLAGVAVGASFVGLATSALVVAEAVRITMGEPGLALVDGSLDDLENVASISARRAPIYTLGYTAAA